MSRWGWGVGRERARGHNLQQPPTVEIHNQAALPSVCVRGGGSYTPIQPNPNNSPDDVGVAPVVHDGRAHHLLPHSGPKSHAIGLGALCRGTWGEEGGQEQGEEGQEEGEAVARGGGCGVSSPPTAAAPSLR